jgi:hypothetical protein
MPFLPATSEFQKTPAAAAAPRPSAATAQAPPAWAQPRMAWPFRVATPLSGRRSVLPAGPSFTA